MNKYSACLIASLTFILVGVFAYMFRYEPLPGVYQPGELVQVWDRWGQRICTVSFYFKGVACSPTALEKSVSMNGKNATQAQSLEDKIRILRSAGFSEQEISDWVKQQQSKQDK